MSFPRAWARLPGPADLLNAVMDDLISRNSVFVGLPESVSGTMFAVEVAELVTRRRLSRWESIRSSEAGTAVPSELVSRRLNRRTVKEYILWVDATDAESVAAAWADYALSLSGARESPRLCIGMAATRAAMCREDRGLRRRVWCDFVSAADSRVLAERSSRRRGDGLLHAALKSALVAELAGADLAAAEQLSRSPLRCMVDTHRHPAELIWAAQVSILFPVVERERRRLLESYRSFWNLPHTRKDGTNVLNPEDLQIGDMVYQAQRVKALAGEQPRLNWLRRVRNALAHGEAVPWPILVSPVALQVADLRE